MVGRWFMSFCVKWPIFRGFCCSFWRDLFINKILQPHMIHITITIDSLRRDTLLRHWGVLPVCYFWNLRRLGLASASKLDGLTLSFNEGLWKIMENQHLNELSTIKEENMNAWCRKATDRWGWWKDIFFVDLPSSNRWLPNLQLSNIGCNYKSS